MEEVSVIGKIDGNNPIEMDNKIVEERNHKLDAGVLIKVCKIRASFKTKSKCVKIVTFLTQNPTNKYQQNRHSKSKINSV